VTSPSSSQAASITTTEARYSSIEGAWGGKGLEKLDFRRTHGRLAATHA
jgi:hypothetical protein